MLFRSSQYRGTNPFMNRRWDEASRLFVPADQPSWMYPVRNLGYEEVGEIVEVGSAVRDVRVGEYVFGTWGHRTHHVAPVEYARDRLMPEGAIAALPDEAQLVACCTRDPGKAAAFAGVTATYDGLFGVPFPYSMGVARAPERRSSACRLGAACALLPAAAALRERAQVPGGLRDAGDAAARPYMEIGRASCRERV